MLGEPAAKVCDRVDELVRYVQEQLQNRSAEKALGPPVYDEKMYAGLHPRLRVQS